MPPPRQGDRKKAPAKPKLQRAQQKQPNRKADQDDHSSPINLSTSIPLSLQQLLLDVFKTALLAPSSRTPVQSTDSPPTNQQPHPNRGPPAQLDTKSLIQTIKAHLYQRDFDSAFTDAEEALLHVYALRWSAARALGYAGIFKAVFKYMCEANGVNSNTRVVCIGGGAGAEIVALAAAWRDLHENVEQLGGRLAGVSLEKNDTLGSLAVAAVDVADWSSVVERLEKTIVSSQVPTSKSSRHQPPLVGDGSGEFSVSFSRTDVLGIAESDLGDVFLDGSTDAQPALLVTLMFTLNELFSTSMAKATGLLLRMTEILPPGAVLLVVDSPGSYSTLKLGKGKDDVAQERNYPMKFLLDHTLLSVAEGKWERVLSQDSRWWRRDAARLRYDVGEGAGLEDMRFQVHVYRRLT